MDKSNLEKRINCKKRWMLTYFKCLIFACLFQDVHSLTTICGDFFQIGTGSKTFFSPNYPSIYDNGTNCIWMIEASDGYAVMLTFTFTGERYDGNCADYIRVRDGGPSNDVINEYCDTYTNEQVTSTTEHMFIQLRSDHVLGSGTAFAGVVSAVQTNISQYNARFKECRSYEFECANHVCISMSYRCDDYNDCGCISECDEDGCGSLSIDTATQVGVSVTVGAFVFVSICALAYFIEGKSSWSAHKKKITNNEGNGQRKELMNSSKFDRTPLFDSTKNNKNQSRLNVIDINN